MWQAASQFERKSEPRSAHRPEWRQELVEAESGLRIGLRADSTFFVDFFVASILGVTAFILEVGWQGWAILIVSAGTVLATQLMRAAIRVLVVQSQLSESGRAQVLQLTTAAVTTVNVTAFTAAMIVFAMTFQ